MLYYIQYLVLKPIITPYDWRIESYVGFKTPRPSFKRTPIISLHWQPAQQLMTKLPQESPHETRDIVLEEVGTGMKIQKAFLIVKVLAIKLSTRFSPGFTYKLNKLIEDNPGQSGYQWHCLGVGTKHRRCPTGLCSR